MCVCVCESSRQCCRCAYVEHESGTFKVFECRRWETLLLLLISLSVLWLSECCVYSGIVPLPMFSCCSTGQCSQSHAFSFFYSFCLFLSVSPFPPGSYITVFISFPLAFWLYWLVLEFFNSFSFFCLSFFFLFFVFILIFSLSWFYLVSSFSCILWLVVGPFFPIGLIFLFLSVSFFILCLVCFFSHSLIHSVLSFFCVTLTLWHYIFVS